MHQPVGRPPTVVMGPVTAGRDAAESTLGPVAIDAIEVWLAGVSQQL
ncbi:MAG: hypothetical protein AAF467_11115 [Actinomycetota bacterium]